MPRSGEAASGSSEVSIGELARVTGVAPATLRMWEARYGFPIPSREGRGGHRRYARDEIARVKRVVGERERGLSLPVAIEQVRQWDPSAPPSLFSALMAAQPGVQTHRLTVAGMLAISEAIEEECLARGARPLLAASFQTERAYRLVETRWRELARTAAMAFVLADFPRRRSPRGAPAEVPLDPRSPATREWAVVCVDQRLTACLSGWEQPRDGRERCFEAAWTTDPLVTASVMRSALALAGRPLQAAGEQALAAIPLAGAGDAAATTALANRMIARLAPGPGRPPERRR